LSTIGGADAVVRTEVIGATVTEIVTVNVTAALLWTERAVSPGKRTASANEAKVAAAVVSGRSVPSREVSVIFFSLYNQ
jgi:hypothetical protein